MSVKNLFISLCLACLLLPLGLDQAQAAGEQNFKYGVGLYKAKRYKEAARYLEKALADGNGSADCYLYLAKAHYGSGNVAMAIKRFRDAEEAFQGLPAAKFSTKMLQRLDPHNKTKRTTKGQKPVAAATTAAPAQTSKAASRKKAAAPPPTGVLSRISVTPPRFGHKPVRQESIAAVRNALKNLPPHLRKRLDDCGASVSISNNLIDKWPDSVNTLPEDNPAKTLAELPGRIYGKEMNIYESEKRRRSTSLKRPRPASMMAHTVLNESVQILDDLMTISKDPGLRKVYNLDKSRVPFSAQQRLATFLKNDDWGPRETCAELGAAMLGGGDEHTQDLYRYFPNTKAWLKKKLGI